MATSCTPRRTTENYDPKILIEKIREISFLKIVPLKLAHFEKALSLSQEYRLDLEDAIHLAVAIENKCKGIYSNDKDFDKTLLTRQFR